MSTRIPKDSLTQRPQRSFPHVLTTLLQEALRSVPEFDRIAQIIKLDPALTANVLSLVNSPFYGLSQKILDLQRAVVILGTREILKITLSIFLVEAVRSRKGNDPYTLLSWRTIIWSALAAQALAEHHCPEKADLADLAYLSALLKDLSLLLPETELSLAEDDPGHEAGCQESERKKHANLSYDLLSERDLPQEMLDAILHHHDVDGLKEHAPLTQYVIMGTRWAEMELSLDTDPLQLVSFKYTLRDHFSLSKGTYEDLRALTLQRFASLTTLLKLEDLESDPRLNSLSLETIQRIFFLSLDLTHVSGGLESLARIIQKHLNFQWNLRAWELGLKWPREPQWSLYRCRPERDTGKVLHEAQAYILPQDIVWTYQGHSFALGNGDQTLGELRIPKKYLDQETLTQIGYYTRFLSQALEQYFQRTAVLEDKSRILDKLPIGVAWLNASGRVIDANPSLGRLLGMDVVHDKDLYAALNTHGLLLAEAPWRSFLEDAQQTSISALLCPSPLTQEISTPCLYLSAHKIPNDKRKDILVLLEKVKDIAELQVQLLKQRDFLRGLISAMQDVILTTDAHGKITFTSSQLPPDILGKNLFTIAKPVGEFAGSWDANRLEGTTTPQEVVLFLEGGPALPLELLFSPLPSEAGKDKEFLVVGRDLNTIRRLEKKVRQQAMFDELTGLFNHRYFLEILDRETLRARRSKRPLSLIFFDLDRFKAINDTHGHQAGDEILRSMGKLLRKIVRKGVDFPARYGGDEFAVLANETEENQVRRLAERIKNAAEERFQGVIGLSIGLAHFDQQESPQQFLKRADRASYVAKQAGGGRIVAA